jgi:NAD(P)-dependent dehydrogenase (short-subunit alcohol dehydrogenase family)
MSEGARQNTRSAVVVEAGSGLGRAVALALASRGWIVFGTAATSAEGCEVGRTSGGRVSLTACDLAKSAAVGAWSCGVIDALGVSGLALVVNCSTQRLQGPMEALPADALRVGLEREVLSAITAINVFLPALRAARGKIVQVNLRSSTASQPFIGPSHAASAAMNALTEVYRAELVGQHIAVMTVAVERNRDAEADTAADVRRMREGLTASQRRLYGISVRQLANSVLPDAAVIDLQAVANRVVDCMEQHPTPAFAVVGNSVGSTAATGHRDAGVDAAISALRL